jgi:hypothetical protein
MFSMEYFLVTYQAFILQIFRKYHFLTLSRSAPLFKYSLFSSKMSLLLQKSSKLINQIFQQKTQSKEIQDPRISLSQNLKKTRFFSFCCCVFFSLHSSELLSSFGKKWEKKSCDAIILLRKEIGDWRGQGGHKNRLDERRLFGDRS